MVRAPYFDENGIRKGAWSEDEDKRLIAYIERYGHPNWRQLPKSAGLARCGKSCRLRWMNYLRPNLKRGKYTQKEEQMIMDLHREHGNKWSLIAEKLPGRTDNEIKNYWHSHLKKYPNRNVDDFKSKTSHESPRRSEVAVLESSMSNLSSETSITEDNNSLSFSSGRTTESTRELVEDSVASWETTFDGFSCNFWTEPFISDNALLSQDYYFIPDSERDEPFFLW